MTIHFAAIGLNHYHIYNMIDSLLPAGAELVSFFSDDPQHIDTFQQRHPQVTLAHSIAEILEDATIHLVASAAVPDRRAPLGIQVMRHDKDYLCAKPAFTTLEQLAEARRVQAESNRKYIVYFGERFGNAATVKAGELVHAGAIGRVVQSVGFGPHRLLGHVPRPDWTFQRPRFGGIINDLASHQIDQFLFFTGSTSADILAARTDNVKFSQYPDFEDFGELLLHSGHASGYIRVDWLTPDGLPTWGDVRLFLLGTDGYIEIRKNCDIGGRDGGNHLFLADKKGVHYLDCQDEPLPFGAQLVHDLQHRTETAVGQVHVFTVCELALQAQRLALISNSRG